MKTLDQIGIRHGTDKSSNIHDYCRKYEKYFPFKRDAVLNILEIGVLNGESLKMWEEYYPNATICGIDIDPGCRKYESDNIKIRIGSQNDKEFLNSIKDEFDLIIDDGSHEMPDVIFTYEELFPKVKSGGIYVVEDSCTSYWPEYGGERYKESSVIEYFKKIVDEVNFFGERYEENDQCHPNRKDDNLIEQFKRKGYDYKGTEIESLNFLNSLIIITKR
jgi:hypothetical protein